MSLDTFSAVGAGLPATGDAIYGVISRASPLPRKSVSR